MYPTKGTLTGNVDLGARGGGIPPLGAACERLVRWSVNVARNSTCCSRPCFGDQQKREKELAEKRACSAALRDIIKELREENASP